jgi:hypothetical protein
MTCQQQLLHQQHLQLKLKLLQQLQRLKRLQLQR